MRNRKIQRELARRGIEKIDRKDFCGVTDLTPYNANERIRQKAIAEIKQELLKEDKLRRAAPAGHFCTQEEGRSA